MKSWFEYEHDQIFNGGRLRWFDQNMFACEFKYFLAMEYSGICSVVIWNAVALTYNGLIPPLGLAVDHGPVCYACPQQSSADTCTRIEHCGRDESCYIERGVIAGQIVYATSCINTLVSIVKLIYYNRISLEKIMVYVGSRTC